jgi:threonine dehydrogenase-like Zn-dependent dehydrogenase
MGRVVRYAAPSTAVVVDEEEPTLRPDEVRLHTLFSGISAGTELSFYRDTNSFREKYWDKDRRLFIPKGGEKSGKKPTVPPVRVFPSARSFDYPMDGGGSYEEVGRVVEVGSDVDNVQVGQTIWGTWGHRSSVVQSGEYVAARVLDPSAPPILGIFSQITAIALNVVLDADIHVGEIVAVFGLGVPGQIVAQLARLNGARVIGVDAIPSRLDMARRLGAWETIEAGGGGVAERIRELTDGRGADVCIEVSGSYRALHEAIRSVAYSARVVSAGFFQGEGAGLTLGEEFHNNRVQVICSQIFGLSPTLSYRWDTYRLQRTGLALSISGQLQLQPLISHTVPAEDAPKAFEMLDHSPEEALQVVLQFEDVDGGPAQG